MSGSEPVTGVTSARLQSLTAYLMLRRGTPHARSHVAAIFWPESSDGQARTNLRKLVLELRRVIPSVDRHLHTTEHTIEWLAASPLTLDVDEFTGEIGPGASLVGLRRAVAAYRGDLLPQCYDDWIIPERERLRQAYMDVLDRIMVLLERRREYTEAIRYGRLLLQHDPLQEATARNLMRLHALMGDRTGAVRVYHACVTVLQRELGVSPSQATHEAYERLLAAAPSGAPSDATPPAAQPAMVGRLAEWEGMQRAWQAAAAGSARVVVLRGEAGVGKSRLAEELLDWTVRQGIATARARCYAAEARLAYAPVTSLLRSRPLPALPPESRRDLSRLLPEFLAEEPTIATQGPVTEGWQRQRLFESLARALLADQPLLVVVDDLHWCDEESLEWLHYTIRHEPGARVLLVVTVRPEEVGDDHPLHRTLASWRHSGLLDEIDLGPLDRGDTARLAAAVVDAPLDDEAAARVFGETEGNPLFTVEIARAGLIRRGQVVGGALPSKVQEVIRARLDRLTPAARDLAAMAATFGRSFTFRLLAQASGEEEGALIERLNELWHRRIIREHEADAYDFSHDKLREVAYAGQSEPVRRWRHLRVAETLEAYRADLDEWSGQIGRHFERAGVPDRAVPYYERAAENARRIYANDAAVAHYERLLALVRGTHRITIMRRLANVWQQTGRWAQAEDSLRRALALAEEESDVAARAECQVGLGLVLRLRGQYAQALAVLAEAQAVFESTGPSRGLARAIGNTGVVHYEMGDYAAALRCFERQGEIASAIGDDAELSTSLRDRGLVSWSLGDYDRALSFHQQHLDMASARGDRRGVDGMNALNNLGLVRRALGDLTGALTNHRESLDIARDIGNRRGIGVALGNIGIDHEEQGNYDEAFRCLAQQLAIAAELGDRRSVGHAMWHLGNLYEAVGRTGDAEHCFGHQLSVATEIEDRPVVAIALGNIARLRAAGGHDREAERLYRQSLALLTELRLPHYQAEVRYRLADLCFRLGQAAEARKEVDSALALAKGIGRTPIVFACELLDVKLRRVEGSNDVTAAERALRMLLWRYPERRFSTPTWYELWRLTGADEPRQLAVAGYRDLFDRVPRTEYRARYDALTGARLPDPPTLPELASILPEEPDLASALRRADRFLVRTAG
jgi:tetratricopeptide (TPR) repeat protein